MSFVNFDIFQNKIEVAIRHETKVQIMSINMFTTIQI